MVLLPRRGFFDEQEQLPTNAWPWNEHERTTGNEQPNRKEAKPQPARLS
jgi:hypothetical protein